MQIKFLFIFLSLAFFTDIKYPADVAPAAEQICGKWETAENNLIVLVFMKGNKFQGKIIWYSDTGGKPMDYGTDKRNPDPALRSRKILGMSVLRDLSYQPASNSWEDGIIYESKNGREWNASVYIDKHGFLKVKGYWHFKLIGKTMTFHRV